MRTTLLQKSMLLVSSLFVSISGLYAQQGINQHIPTSPQQIVDSGIYWPNGQALPHFATPASQLDGFDLRQAKLPVEEKTMLLSLQGVVNKKQPRIFLFEHFSEGKYKWPKILNLSIHEFETTECLKLVDKYKNELKGVILYDRTKSDHYLNLASTVAGLENAIPVTTQLYDRLKEQGIQLPIIADFTKLPYTKATEIYEYMFQNYRNKCTHRLLVSLPPQRGFVRDLAIASGAAIVWLDPREWQENTVLRKFLKTMKPGESIITGWYAEERSGIGLATEYGLSTIPSDFYENATVYAGMQQQIQYPEVPKMPELENKIYLAIYLSDGDNVQYCQHAMSELWDKAGRGSIPINWTISPGLVDFGPGLLNHYYKTATPNDFFASGPSGMGYSLIYDAHNYLWNATSGADFTPYAKLTQQYLEKSGLRVITIWDEVNQEQMSAYAQNCRYLYGLTQQDWERRPYKVPAYIQNHQLAFVPNLPCYASGVDVIYSFWKDQIAKFDGSKPIFLSAQGESWKMGPDNIVALKKQLEELSPGNIVICRGDHFFNLYNQANNLPFNLTLSPKMKITSSSTTTNVKTAADGTHGEGHIWISKEKGNEAWIQFDFKEQYLISRYVVRHAENAGMPKQLNTSSFTMEVSQDGKKWTYVDTQKNNTASVTDVDITPAKGRYVRLQIQDAGEDGTARIGDIEIYGRISGS
ncbi:discoidin domain-containing protein [Bacteroides sp.]|uniref:discoidin domain-containing protein n=1 Tax=Bacteroides sp. TaxID=29523 RepID=UPI002623A843|nr:discoidin domain-containing protein [Bacteroides sp.]MDD3036521.1 GxGYxYP family putative glycoside hydrolase [Bacteroides sp.]